MTGNGRPRFPRTIYALLLALCVAITAGVLLSAILLRGHFQARALRDLGLPLLAALVAVSALALRGWWLELLAGRRAAEETARQAEEEMRELREERRELARLREMRQTEQRWLAHLRDEVAVAQKTRGALGADDVRGLVLRIAMNLLDAQKGLLLTRTDEDGDGNLDLVAAIGFDNDPSDSAVTQRLAASVLRRDEILHEDDSSAIGHDARTPADAEIANLVAIPVYIAEEFSGVVVCANRDGGFAECDDEVLLALGDHTGAILQNGRLHGELRNAYLGTVALLSEAIGAKDPLLKGHSEDVAGLVAAVAHRLGIEPARREELLFGSLLHDIGKLGVSEQILLKPGALTPEERKAVELHPRIGFRMVQRVPALRAIAPAVLHHHERIDGAGYPSGLRGDAIPLEARIVAVADCFSAMTQDRPYRKAMSREDACEELIRGAGTQWDPAVVEVFVEELRLRAGRGESESESVLVGAPDDAELDVLRAADGPMLGTGAVELTDPLTLLYSHRYFHEQAAIEARRAVLQGVGFAVVVGRLVRLSELNRDDGFAAGDEALRALGAAFERAAASRPGTLAARVSGSRVGLLATGVSPEEAESWVAAELPDEHEVALTAVAWQHGEDGFAVIGRAKATPGAVRADSGA